MPPGRLGLADGRVEGTDPLADFSPTAPQHLLRTEDFTHVADIMIGSFYDADMDTGCAFEELISFHGGIGGPQTRPFVLHPSALSGDETVAVESSGVLGRIGVPGQGLLLGSTGGAGRW